MQTVIAFDTHSLVKRLKSVGFTEEQSEVFAEEQARIIDERLATKQDIVALQRDMKALETSLKRDMKELEAGLRRDMKELETNFKRDMKELEYRMTIKLGTLMVVAIGAVAALVKLL